MPSHPSIITGRVRNAKRQPGVDEILLPGERGNRLAAGRLASGTIPIEPNMLESLRAIAAKHDAQSTSTANTLDPWDSLDVATKLVGICIGCLTSIAAHLAP